MKKSVKKVFNLGFILIVLVLSLVLILINLSITERIYFSPEDFSSGLVLKYDFDTLAFSKTPFSFEAGNSTNRLNLGENLKIIPSLNSNNLGTVLRNETYSDNSGNKHIYSQVISFSEDFILTHNQSKQNNSVIGLKSASGSVFQYTLELGELIGNINSLKNTSLRMLGREYYLFSADSNNLNLFEEVSSTNFIVKNNSISGSGEQKAISTSEGSFIVYAESITSNSADIFVNSLSSISVTIGSILKVPNYNYYLAIQNISVMNNIGRVEFILAKNRITIPFSGAVKFNDNSTNFSSSSVGFPTTNKKLILSYSGKDFIYSGNNFLLPVFESFEISVSNLVTPQTYDEVIITNESTGIKMSLSVKDGGVRIDLLNSTNKVSTLANSQFFYGTNSDNQSLVSSFTNELILLNGTIEGRNFPPEKHYFVASWNNETSGESYLIQVKTISTSDPAKNTTTFTNKANNQDFSIDLGQNYTLGKLKINLYSAKTTQLSIRIYPVSSGEVNFSKIYTSRGLLIKLPNSQNPTSLVLNESFGSSSFGLNLSSLSVFPEIASVYDSSSNSNISYVTSKFSTKIIKTSSSLNVNYFGQETYSPVTFQENNNKIYSIETIQDLVGSNNGLIRGAQFTSGHSQDGMSLDSSYVEIPNSPILENLQEVEYTFSVWYKPLRSDSTKQSILMKDLPDSDSSIGLSYKDSKFSMTHYKGENVLSANSLNHGAGYFYHIVGVVSSNNVSIFVNGIKEGESASLPGFAKEYGANKFFLGTSGITLSNILKNPAKGIIDDVMIWNRVLSTEEIEDLYSSYYTNSLIAKYSFDLQNGSDSFGRNNADYIKCNFSLGVGDRGYAAEFNFSDSNNYINIPLSSTFALGEAGLSYSLWIKISSFENKNSTIFYFNDGSKISLQNNSLLVEMTFTDSSFSPKIKEIFRGKTNLSLNQWYHLALNWKANEVAKLYLDGNLEGNGSLKYESLYNSFGSPIKIGGEVDTFGKTFPGKIDEFKIFNKQLTEKEISLDFSSLLCGNNLIDSGEVCDGSNLNGETCISRGYGSGTLSCSLDCSGYITSNCVPVSPACTPTLIPHYTGCRVDDTNITWYTDSNNCGSVPANITNYCDYDGNGIIGNFSSLTQTNLAISVYVDDVLGNISRNYNNTRNVEIRESDLVRVEFDYNFSLSPLNFKTIEIKKQPSGFSYGYLIVNGIESTKIIRVDRINGSSQICIRNTENTQLSDFSSGCDRSSEILLSCPGNNSQYRCNITESKFLVTGLTHSAVREYVLGSSTSNIPSGSTGSPSSGCTPSWSCTWGICTNNLQIYDCVDTRNCNSTLNRPAQNSRVCNSSTSSTSSPINLGGTEEPSTTQFLFWLFVIILIILIGIVGFILIRTLTNKED